jgi:hypothetical protein
VAWLTERELRDGEAADWLPPGHLPDGVLVATAKGDGEVARLAVEVELHHKAAARYGPKLAWYRAALDAGAVHMVAWYVPNDAVGGVVRRALAAAGLGGDGRLLVEPLPPECLVYAA